MSAKVQKQSPPTNRFVDPRPQQLRSLILDYLCHNCYTQTARAFANDSVVRHLDADGDEVERPGREGDSAGITEEDLQQVELRKDIKMNLLAGRVDEATSLLNQHFPAVLSTTESVEEPERALSSSDAVIESILPCSVEPEHLFLNLRILAFIEASRTMPLENGSNNTSLSLVPPTTNPEGASLLDDSEDPNIRTPSLPDTDAHLECLLRHARELYNCAQMLKDPADRAAYQKELASICSLLAYKVPERSPMAKYLTQSRREQVANDINSAILYNARRPPISYLELYVRYTTVLLNNLNQLRVKVPPASSMPAGVRFPHRQQASPTVTPSITPVPSKGQADRDRDGADIIPPFDLKQFLSP